MNSKKRIDNSLLRLLGISFFHLCSAKIFPHVNHPKEMCFLNKNPNCYSKYIMQHKKNKNNFNV